MAMLTEGYSLETPPTIGAVRASLLQNMKRSMGAFRPWSCLSAPSARAASRRPARVPDRRDKPAIPSRFAV